MLRVGASVSLARGLSLALLVSGTMIAGCQSQHPPTQVLVLVDAQPLVRSDARQLELVVRSGLSTSALDEEPYRMTLPGPVSWPADLTLVPLGGDLTRVFEVEATALDVSGHAVAQARLRGGFVVHEARTLRLILEDRCRGITCGDGFTCRAGRCVQLVDPGTDAGTPDLDGGVEGDAAIVCTTDTDCDDHVYCNGVETCSSGSCMPGTIVVCDDGVACTTDLCEGTGCVHRPDASACTLGPDPVCDPTNGCQYSVCDATTCTAGPCQMASCSGTTCMRTSRCGAGEMCCGTSCVAAGCADTDPCTADACDASTGACAHEPSSGASCNDGNACTQGDVCTAGHCGGGTVSCDDMNDCTMDSCDNGSGCVHTPGSATARCDDHNPCTPTDQCDASGVCIGHGGCDDGIACTVDSCGPTGCVNTPTDSLCTASSMGRCVAGAGCQYGTSCTSASCAPANACETAMCSGSTCMRGSACAAGESCCGGTCLDCDDHNPCTDDSCGMGSCNHTPNNAPCNDGSACTMNDMCMAGTCTGAPVTCMDGNSCTVDGCNPASGCTFMAAPDNAMCDDGNPCTVGERCASGSCFGGATNSCDDFNECTTDSCSPGTGCINTPRLANTLCGVHDFDTCSDQACDGAGNCSLIRPECRPPQNFCCSGICTGIGDCS